ncbi:hypothetical protein NN561_010514 [Cricetulus griseus]
MQGPAVAWGDRVGAATCGDSPPSSTSSIAAPRALPGRSHQGRRHLRFLSFPAAVAREHCGNCSPACLVPALRPGDPSPGLDQPFLQLAGGPPQQFALSNSAAIRAEIQRFESVHPNIYAIYDLIERIEDLALQNQIREHVISIEGERGRGAAGAGARGPLQRRAGPGTPRPRPGPSPVPRGVVKLSFAVC